MKIFTRRLLTLVSLMLSALGASAYDFEVDGLYYTILSYEDKTVKVMPLNVNDNGSYVTGALNLPAHVTHNDIRYTVTEIGDNAFTGCTKMVSVTLPETIVTIGQEAFRGCTGLSYFEIPNSVKTLGPHCFYNCSMLQYVEMGESVETIGYSAFHGCKLLPSIEIPDGVTSIGYSAFYECESIESITLPNSVTSLGSSAFSGCINLKSAKLSDGLTTLEAQTFLSCTSLSEVKLPAALETIGEAAFQWCYALENITLSSGLKNIGRSAFLDCKVLKSITIPSSVTAIGYQAFNNCPELAEVTFDDVENSQCEELEYGAFSACPKLTSFQIPNSVKTIGTNAFQGCSALEQVTLPNELVTLPAYVFNGCPLASITLPETLQYIEKSALNDAAFTSIILPESVISLGTWCFNANTLGIIFCKATTPPSATTDVFYSSWYNMYDTAILCVPDGSIKKYQSISPWNGFNSIEESDFVDAEKYQGVIEQEGLRYKVTSAKDKTVAVTYSSAFSSNNPGSNSSYVSGDVMISETAECNGLTFTVTSVGEAAFTNCANMTSVEIPASVETIVAKAFNGCTRLKTVTLHGATSLEANAFSSTNSITEIHCDSALPAEGSEDAFTSSVYEKAILYIPQGADEAYLETTPWNLFANIKTADSAALNAVNAEPGTAIHVDGNAIVIPAAAGPAKVYAIDGALVAQTSTTTARLTNLPHGLYIIVTPTQSLKLKL